MRHKKDKKNIWHCVMIIMALLIFIGIIYTSQASAQWPPYGNPLINPLFSIFNVMPSYYYTISYPSVGSLLPIGSWPIYWINPYFNNTTLFPPYLGSNDYRQYYPIPFYNTTPDLPSMIIMEWQSQVHTDEYGDKLKGYVVIDRTNNTLIIQNAYYDRGEGVLTDFDYTPQPGNTQILIMGEFDSLYPAYKPYAIFRGTVFNDVNNIISSGSPFIIQGEYEIAGLSMVEDKGVFRYPPWP